MENNYYRITGYCPENDFCFIMDCYEMFEKMWQFSSALIQKQLKILEVSSEEKFLDVNIQKIEEDKLHFILRAVADGKPQNIEQILDGIKYKAIKVVDKIYIPNKEQIKT